MSRKSLENFSFMNASPQTARTHKRIWTYRAEIMARKNLMIDTPARR